jgi:NTE family protein
VFSTISLSAQKVGLVLSGGGSSGITHVGVIKALEEYGIPIDYITGTSMGALVGALYATGYSPEEIEAFFLSDEFQNWTTGSVDNNYSYYLRKKEDDASLITLKLSTDTLWEFNLPTNLVSSSTINYGLLSFFSPSTTYAKEDFNNLFIPFRCVASDIISKKEIVFSNGKLTTAVRASMAYPFYLKPVTYNDMLLFDGGLYNNFPANVMEEDFNPDFIIGSNVSFNFEKPHEDNIVSQIKTIVTNDTKYVIPEGKGLMIEPNVTDNATFNFDNNEKLIKIGYDATVSKIVEIRKEVKDYRSKSETINKRDQYKKELPNFIINKVVVDGLKVNQNSYIKNSLRLKNKTISPEKLKPEYIKLLSDDKIKSIRPEVQFNDTSGYYTLKLNAKKEKDLFVSVGGLISSRPISEGFIGVQYNLLDKAALTLLANTYFGRFHNSIQTGFRLDIPFVIPFYWKNTFNMGNWDYYKSNNVFFEDKKPSFLVNNDMYAKTEIGLPVFYKGKLVFEGSTGDFTNEYYQTKNFLSTDTTDETHFTNILGGIKYERNSLNRKQYSSEGSFFAINYKYVKGKEETIFGSTSNNTETIENNIEWGQIKVSYEQYFNIKHNVRFGLFGEGVYSNQPFFSNYTATLLASPDFQPFTENRTVFNQNLRAHSYIAFGVKNIYYLFNKFQLRLEGYAFQPYQNILSDVNQKAYYSKEWTNTQYMASSSLVYYTPIGPIALNLNYYDRATDNWSFLFHFGYVIFNKKSLD